MKSKRCAFHTSQPLVNFCRSPECLLPMCPSCVKVHSSEHARLNTHGFYDCMSDIQKQVQNTLENTMKNIITSGNELKQIFQSRQMERTLLIGKLKQVRCKVIETVHKYIDGLQENIMEQFSSIQSFSSEEFSQIDAKMQKISSEAQKQLENLNGQKSIKAIINHISCNMPAYYNYHLSEISTKIKDMKVSQTSFQNEFKMVSINEALKVIGQCYNLNFSQPIRRRSLKKLTMRDSNASKISKESSTQGSFKKVL